MSESGKADSIESSISLVESALRAHARAVQHHPENVAAIIEAGNALRQEVLEYERVLMDETGWSNPVRHLGPQPAHSRVQGLDDIDLKSGSDAIQVSVSAEYIVAVDSQWGIETFVEARGGERPNSIVEAISYLYECDGWDAAQYPPRRIRLVSRRHDVSLTTDEE